MNYKEGDRVIGEIYKGDDRITGVKHGSVTKRADGVLQFDVIARGWTSQIEVGDECRLITDDGETKVKLTAMHTTGEAPQQATFMMFTFV